MISTDIVVKTDSFDGPLALLLMLIQKEEMDIRALDINKITGEYIDYLERMNNLNFDIAGDYLYMAATLVFLKSKSCVTEEDITAMTGEEVNTGLHISTQEELMQRLQELKKFQMLGHKIWEMPKVGHDVFLRPRVNKKAIIHSINNPMDLTELTKSMIDLIKREKRKYKVVKRDRLSIKEKLYFLKQFLKKGIPSNFFDLLKSDQKVEHGERDNKVITFISLLELARLKKIGIFQNEEFGNIYINVKESLDDFNVELADGFENEEEAEATKEKEEMDTMITDSMNIKNDDAVQPQPLN